MTSYAFTDEGLVIFANGERIVLPLSPEQLLTLAAQAAQAAAKGFRK